MRIDKGIVMEMAFKVAHMSDLHYAPATLPEVDACFGAAVTAAISANVDVAVITGDSTDHRLDAHSPALIALMRQVKRLAEHCPVVMLQGTFSHEPPGMLQVIGLMGTKHPVFIADKIGHVALVDGKWVEFHTFADLLATPSLVVTALPSVNKAVLLANVGHNSPDGTLGKAVGEVSRDSHWLHFGAWRSDAWNGP
jgi:DNA repair protein SbcD/Mre11